MKYKFNPYERAVGFFIVTALTGSVMIGSALAIRKNWFEEKKMYVTYTDNAANLREGSAVLMTGLKVGKVEKIELDTSSRIKVTFSVAGNYVHFLTAGTVVQFIRPYIIGERSLILLQGPVDAPRLAFGETLPVRQGLDLMEILNGQKLESMLVKVDRILNNLDATMESGRDIAQLMNNKKQIKKTMDDLSFTLAELRKVMPHVSSRTPASAEHLARTIENLDHLTSTIRDLRPEGAKTIELLNESLITLRAMQKSFFMKGNVEEVKQEMATTGKK